MADIRSSSRARSITDSITLAISARAKAMRDEGIDVVSLGAGEPDFRTPEPVGEAGIEAIREGRTRYTPAPGMSELREAGARWFQRRFDLPFQRDQVMATAGAKPALTMALSALLDPGDHVLLPTPYWPSYPEIVRLWDGAPVDVPVGADQGFVPSGPQIEEAARRHGAKGLLINFPNNPSGAVPSREQVEQIVDAALATGMWILSDEIYARLIYDGAPHVSPAEFERARDRVLVVNGGTKSHSMTGWRIGFLAGPARIVAAASRIQSQAVGNPCTISQIAAMAMCDEDADTEFERRLAAFDERRRYLWKEINATEELGLDLPQGAFYGLVDVRQPCGRLGCDDVQLAERLLTEGLVATVPGSAFAAPGFIRASYAASMQDLETAVQRIRSFLASTR